jgi:hypothetical protein
VVPIWTMGGMLTLAIILKILHLAAQHKESTAIYPFGNSFLNGTVRLDWIRVLSSEPLHAKMNLISCLFGSRFTCAKTLNRARDYSS